MNIKFFIFSLIICVLSCGGSLDVEEHLFDKYYLIATDTKEDLNLSYHESTDNPNYGTIIKATVFAIGYNDKYILIKQHPRNFPDPPNRKITNYYIIPVKKKFNWKSMNGLLGPMTLNQFIEKKKELHISDSLTFNKVMNDLE